MATAKTELKPKRMLVTGIICPRCDDKIWSRHRHDYRHCKCGYCAIDGGREYTKTSYGVGLPEGRQNDGTVTEAEWAAVTLENERIGKPRIIRMYVPRPPERKEQEWPYPGWSARQLLETMLDQAVKEHKKKPKKEKSDELPKPRNRKQTDSLQPATRGSKRCPSKPIRTGKNKATVRK